jgi:hypothetical protein
MGAVQTGEYSADSAVLLSTAPIDGRQRCPGLSEPRARSQEGGRCMRKPNSLPDLISELQRECVCDPDAYRKWERAALSVMLAAAALLVIAGAAISLICHSWHPFLIGILIVFGLIVFWFIGLSLSVEAWLSDRKYKKQERLFHAVVAELILRGNAGCAARLLSVFEQAVIDQARDAERNAGGPPMLTISTPPEEFWRLAEKVQDLERSCLASDAGTSAATARSSPRELEEHLRSISAPWILGSVLDEKGTLVQEILETVLHGDSPAFPPPPASPLPPRASTPHPVPMPPPTSHAPSPGWAGRGSACSASTDDSADWVRRGPASEPGSGGASLGETREHIWEDRPTTERGVPASAPVQTTARPVRSQDQGTRAGGAECDPVDCTVFAPPTAAQGDSIMVQVFAHLAEAAESVEKLAKRADESAEWRGAKCLEAQIAHGERLTFHLEMPSLVVEDAVQTLVWNGRPQAVQFSVNVAEDRPRGNAIGTVTVLVRDVPVGHIKFKLAIVHGSEKAEGTTPVPQGDDVRHYRSAFISYASGDRAEVVRRLQMLSTLGIKYFQDVLDLSPGDRWERKLYQHIDECDLFLLFWSNRAKQSEWVRKEVNYALARKRGDEFVPPEIRPVVIEGPPVIPPWEELSHLHLNDMLVYLMGDRTA